MQHEFCIYPMTLLSCLQCIASLLWCKQAHQEQAAPEAAPLPEAEAEAEDDPAEAHAAADLASKEDAGDQQAAEQEADEAEASQAEEEIAGQGPFPVQCFDALDI